MATGAWKPVQEDTSAWKPVPDVPQAKPGLLDTMAANWKNNTTEQPGDDPITTISKRAASNIGQLVSHPIDSITGGLRSAFGTESPEGKVEQPPSLLAPYKGQGFAKGLEHAAGDAAANIVTGGAVEGLRAPIAATAEKLGPAMQDAGVAKINRVVGSLKPDFNRGANPGKGYFQAGMGPSASMGSIAEKAARAKEGFGEQIGDAIDSGTGSGVLIPTSEAVRPIAEPINKWHSILSGPGGGSTVPAEELSASFRPSIQSAAEKGGYTPRELFDVKRNVAQNTSWGDPTQIGGKQVRQQITGGISNTLADHVPEIRDLNSGYQNTSKLALRSADRASTARPSLSAVGKGVANAGMTAIGAATHGPVGALVGALPGMVDSVPIQTGLASGLYYGGGALGRFADRLPASGSLAPAAVLALNNKKVPKLSGNDDSDDGKEKSKK